MSLFAARFSSLALVFALALPALALAGDTKRNVAVPEHGSFEIALPSAWRYSTEAASSTDTDTEKSAPEDAVQGETLRLDPAKGTRFTFQATPAWVPADRRNAREAATWMRVRLHGQTVEQDIPIEEFQGTRNKVYWFKATNKSPTPGEKSVLVQGAATVGELMVAFTLLYFPGDIPEKDLVLSALGSAKHVP
jgi:hypothetical protein